MFAADVRAKGLPLGFSGEDPVARDGVVTHTLALTLIRNTCQRLQLRLDLAEEWLAERGMTDRELRIDVLAVELVMVAVTKQMDRKQTELEVAYARHFPPPVVANDAPTDTPPAAPFLTLEKVQTLLGEIGAGAVTQSQALEVLVDMTQKCGARGATSADFAETCLSHMPRLVSEALPNSQWHPKKPKTVTDSRDLCYLENPKEGAGGEEGDGTFLTTG